MITLHLKILGGLVLGENILLLYVLKWVVLENDYFLVFC